MPFDQLGNDQMSLEEADSRVLLAHSFFLNLHSRLKKFLFRVILVCRGALCSPVSCWNDCCASLALATFFAAEASSGSHQGLALSDGERSLAALAIAFWIVIERVVAYSSNWSSVGESLVKKVLSELETSLSSSSKHLIQSPGATLFIEYFIPSVLLISLRPWLIVNFIPLWSELWEMAGSIAQSLNVSWLQASRFAKERLMTEGRSPS